LAKDGGNGKGRLVPVSIFDQTFDELAGATLVAMLGIPYAFILFLR
jgi:hypothetical protein